MSIKPSLGTVVGLADNVHWGQVFLSPSAYGVVEVEDPAGRARDWGIKALSTLSKLTSDPPKSLKAAQEIAIKAMEERVTSLILLVPVGAILYVVVLGECQVLLKRGEKLAILIDKPGAISGQVLEGDTLILMSSTVSRILTHEEVGALFDHLEAPAVAEKMTLAVHMHQGDSTVSAGAALIFQVKGLTPIEDETSSSFVEEKEVSGGLGRPAFTRVWKTIQHINVKHALHPRYVREYLRKIPNAWARPMIPVTAFLIVLFVASVLLGIRRQMAQRVEGRIAQVLVQAQHAFDEGVALLELNPVKGRERLGVARDALSPLLEGLSPSSLEGKTVAKLYKDVADQLSVAMQVYRKEPMLYYDLSLLKSQASISSIGQYGDIMMLLDSRGPTIATLELLTKNGRIVAGGESYRGAQLVTMHGDYGYILVEGGIHRVLINDEKTTQHIVKKSTQWGNISSLVSYGGNLYLLDSAKSRIWKYIATEKGFSEVSEYLNPDTLPDLSHASGMAVDGGIWTGTRDGKILRFSQGHEETFAPRGVEPALGKTLTVATTEDDKHLYVLDTDNKRVVVLDKDGVYIAQYVWTGNIAPRELFVSEKLKLILLLADGKLYSLELK